MSVGKFGLELDPSDDFLNDGAGVALTRYPPGMVEALAMMEDKHALSKASSITDSLWVRFRPRRTLIDPQSKRV